METLVLANFIILIHHSLKREILDAEKLFTRVDHVNNYRENNLSEREYITYLRLIQFEENTNEDSQQLKINILGNTNQYTNETIKAFSSIANIVALLMVIFITTLFVSKFPKIRMLEGRSSILPVVRESYPLRVLITSEHMSNTLSVSFQFNILELW